MNRIIDKEYVKDNYVQLMMGFGTSDNILVASSNEIIFLVINGEVVVNNYLDHEMRYEFPKSDTSSHINNECNSKVYNMIFRTNTTYIMFYSNKKSSYYSSNIFTKNERGEVLWNEDYFDFGNKSFDGNIFKEKDLEDFILSYNNAIHLVDSKGQIIYSSTSEDGKVVNFNPKRIHFPLVGIFANNNLLEAFLIGKRFNFYLIKNLNLPNILVQSINSCLENPDETTRVNPPSI